MEWRIGQSIPNPQRYCKHRFVWVEICVHYLIYPLYIYCSFTTSVERIGKVEDRRPVKDSDKIKTPAKRAKRKIRKQETRAPNAASGATTAFYDGGLGCNRYHCPTGKCSIGRRPTSHGQIRRKFCIIGSLLELLA